MKEAQKEPVQMKLLGVGNVNEKSILATLQEEATQALKSYTKNLSLLLEKRNISIPPAINLTLTEESYIFVDSQHPNKAKLEDVLNARQMHIDDFKEVEVLHRMIHQLINGQNRAKDVFHVGLTSLGGIAFFTCS